uniref:Uncharacterized protein n=1 Tax=Anopheles melas TaxID=34690 RepID=A0A182TDI0_9DIPT
MADYLVVQRSGNGFGLLNDQRFRRQISGKIVIPVQRDGRFLRRQNVVHVPPGIHVFQFMYVLPAAFFLINPSHMLRLPIRKFIVRDRFLILEPDRRFVMDVDITFDVAARRLCETQMWLR